MDAGLNLLLWVVRLAFLALLWIALGLMALTRLVAWLLGL